MSDEKIHANSPNCRPLCGNALRAFSDDRITSDNSKVNCWECKSML